MITIIPVSEPKRKSVIEDIILTAHSVVVIGRIDTGKSTFCRQLAFYAQEKGMKVAIVDSDVGQSWIGPPTTVGMKVVVDEPYSTLFPDDLYFVGHVTPDRHLLQTAVGAKSMVESAEKANADLIITDTTGWVDRPIGRILKQSKIDLIRPDHIVCFQRDRELEMLIKGIESKLCRIHRLTPSKYAEKKSPEYRTKYRYEQFTRYFANFITQEFEFSQLHSQREYFLNGRCANEDELKNISQIIDEEIIYAELFYKGMLVVTNNKLDWIAEQKISSHLKIDELVSRTPNDYENLLVSLINDKGKTICLGLIEHIDFKEYTLSIKCKNDIREDVKVIQFSDFRLSLNGL